jgi:hypothetical protein
VPAIEERIKNERARQQDERRHRGHERARVFGKNFRKEVPGAKGQPHVIIAGAGHFIHEHHGKELAQVMIASISNTASTK